MMVTGLPNCLTVSAGQVKTKPMRHFRYRSGVKDRGDEKLLKTAYPDLRGLPPTGGSRVTRVASGGGISSEAMDDADGHDGHGVGAASSRRCGHVYTGVLQDVATLWAGPVSTRDV